MFCPGVQGRLGSQTGSLPPNLMSYPVHPLLPRSVLPVLNIPSHGPCRSSPHSPAGAVYPFQMVELGHPMGLAQWGVGAQHQHVRVPHGRGLAPRAPTWSCKMVSAHVAITCHRLAPPSALAQSWLLSRAPPEHALPHTHTQATCPLEAQLPATSQ